MKRFPAKLGFRPILAKSTEDDIRSFELERQIRFADDFREFLLQWNGGTFVGPSVIDRACFAIPEELDLLQEPRPLRFLAGLCPKECYVALHDLEERFGFKRASS